MDNFTLIYKIVINEKIYYLHDCMVKKFDYFKPILENRFGGDLKVKFDCDDLLINKFLVVLHNSSKLSLTLDDVDNIYNLLDYLLCNDKNIYNRLILEYFDLSLENVSLLLNKMGFYNSKFVEYCFDKFVETNKNFISFYDYKHHFCLSFISREIFEFMEKFCIPQTELIYSCLSAYAFAKYYVMCLEIDDISLRLELPLSESTHSANEKYTKEILTKFIKPYYFNK